MYVHWIHQFLLKGWKCVCCINFDVKYFNTVVVGKRMLWFGELCAECLRHRWKLVCSLNIILCGWLGSKHQLTNDHSVLGLSNNIWLVTWNFMPSQPRGSYEGKKNKTKQKTQLIKPYVHVWCPTSVYVGRENRGKKVEWTGTAEIRITNKKQTNCYKFTLLLFLCSL